MDSATRKGYLRLAALHLAGIDVGALEVREPELAWRIVVAMRARDHQWDLKLGEQGPDLGALVVSCPVDGNQRVLPPAAVFSG